MKVKIHYLFSKSEKIGSTLIRWGTKQLVEESVDTPSHIAILVNGKWVFESTMENGVKIVSYKEWLSHRTEVAKIACTKEWEFNEIKQMFRKLGNKKYDKLGILYFAWRVLLNKFMFIDMPKKNKWHSEDKYFCCEVVGQMTGVSYEMTSPVELMVRIKDHLGEFSHS